jgi:hypothetical protein
VHMDSEHVSQPVQLEAAVNDRGPLQVDATLFGPHSPRGQLGQDAAGPMLQEVGPVLGGQGTSPLSEFLVSVSRPVDQGLLPPPPASTDQPLPAPTPPPETEMEKRSSSRLAAKPTAG